MSLYDKVNALFHSKPNSEGVHMNLLSNSLVTGLVSHLISGLVNKLEEHYTVVGNLLDNKQVTPDELHDYNMKLVSLLTSLKPVMDVVVAKYPELLPVISLAENYSKAFEQE